MQMIVEWVFAFILTYYNEETRLNYQNPLGAEMGHDFIIIAPFLPEEKVIHTKKG